MKKVRAFAALAILAGVVGVVAASASMVKITYGKAIEVPGTAALNTGGTAVVNSISCRAASRCAAGGYYTDANANQPFVVDEKKGGWGAAIEVPGIAALGGAGGVVNSVSCGSVGNCEAGGGYFNSISEAFVSSEKNGVWGDAIEVPGTDSLNSAGSAGVSTVSCASAGNCAAGGYFEDGAGYQVFVADETNGVWGTAIEVPGTAALNAGGNAYLNSISCRAGGNCSAGGWYYDGSAYHAFVVTEANGVWGTAIEVPGMAALSTGGEAAVNSVSCTGAASCTAGGYYRIGTADFEAFVVTEKNGVWGTAMQVPGTAALNTGQHAGVNSISCTATGNCSAAGIFRGNGEPIHGFVVSEKSGKWGKAIEVPGSGALTSTYMLPRVISCAAPGYCLAGGFYQDAGGAYQAFVVRQAAGKWGKAVELPGTAALNAGGAAPVNAISCFKSGRCAVGGDYTETGGSTYQAFITTP